LENNFLIKNEATSRKNKPEESTENRVVDYTTEDWNKPEEIENVVSLLASCESLEMLAELRECAIPPAVFKAAAKSLEAGKRQQIKEWVLMLNQVA
jgi:glucose-6-phosphate 1-dehydrogenase